MTIFVRRTTGQEFVITVVLFHYVLHRSAANEYSVDTSSRLAGIGEAIANGTLCFYNMRIEPLDNAMKYMISIV